MRRSTVQTTAPPPLRPLRAAVFAAHREPPTPRAPVRLVWLARCHRPRPLDRACMHSLPLLCPPLAASSNYAHGMRPAARAVPPARIHRRSYRAMRCAARVRHSPQHMPPTRCAPRRRPGTARPRFPLCSAPAHTTSTTAPPPAPRPPRRAAAECCRSAGRAYIYVVI
ncbi:hypothetical protein B0H15DRAFT_825412 [Mycena belliarum]|uniref:Uncharacterized protein n=1 Tax=Mycena belliarum TaxID=1033014 RepID=A0AAD6UG08_9AGAR|nr:hypothetical protein B0H15DRAFT_825412 [Mycena belliae]